MESRLCSRAACQAWIRPRSARCACTGPNRAGVALGAVHVWSSNLTPEIEGIVALSDYLLLNDREFSDAGAARRASPTRPWRNGFLTALTAPTAW
jgi:hypothetical protein